MHVLIVEGDPALGALWKRHLERMGKAVTCVATQDQAVAQLSNRAYGILVLDLLLPEGSALAVADYAAFRRPEMRVIFVTSTTFFSDGSIFQHAGNACAMVQSDTKPEDLDAVVSHYGGGQTQPPTATGL